MITTALDERPLTDEMAEILSAVSYGDRAEVCWTADGIDHKVTVEELIDDQNPVEHINGCDAYGKVAWCQPRRDAYQGCFAGRADDGPRPAGFTGAARKLSTQYGDRYWWEPYREGTKVYDSAADRQIVKDLMEYGLIGFRIVHHQRCACCGMFRSVADASIYGIEAMVSAKDKAEFIRELILEVEA